MNKQAIRAVAGKDIRAIRANLQVWLPMLIVPVILGVVLPGVMTFAMRVSAVGTSDETRQLLSWLDKLPPSALRSTLDAFPDTTQKVLYLMANYMLAPFFLLIPLMTTSVIAADSFAGEKERGTLESLLFSPVDLLSLFAGKALAGILPAVGISLVTFALAVVAVNLAGWPAFGRIFFPTLNWLPLMLLVIPAIAAAAVFFNLWVSARVSSFQAAYQLGGLVVIPMLLLLFGQISGLLLLDAPLLTGIGVGLALLDLLLLRLVVRMLDRTRLFETQIR